MKRKKLSKAEAQRLARDLIGRFGFVRRDPRENMDGREVVCEIVSIGDVREHGRGHGWREAFRNAGLHFD